ncbi:MAG: thioredoxin family protein [Firmicutes bacterium]|nr:thioredoxin family protein [[Eubacterium] siraeum]MCM1487937.1 thioredoxin family protein [Bacillota bacterium]
MKEVNTQEFKDLVSEEKAVLADFYSDTCMPCRRMMPIVEEISEEQRDKLTAVKVNVGAEMDLAVNLGVEAVPTFILFREGKEAARHVGAVPKEELLAFIEKN